MSNFRDTAIVLANRPYSMIVFLDEATDGTLGYVAINPELEGCMSQGDTYNEAVKNLNEARIDYIESMLEEGLPIPEPQLLIGSELFWMSELLSYDEIEDIPYDEIPRDSDVTSSMVETVKPAANL